MCIFRTLIGTRIPIRVSYPTLLLRAQWRFAHSNPFEGLRVLSRAGLTEQTETTGILGSIRALFLPKSLVRQKSAPTRFSQLSNILKHKNYIYNYIKMPKNKRKLHIKHAQRKHTRFNAFSLRTYQMEGNKGCGFSPRLIDAWIT